MVEFFVISEGIYIWLAVIGVLLISATIETDGDNPTVTAANVTAFAVSGALCVGFAVIHSMLNWGVVALAVYVVLAAGLGAMAIGTVYRHSRGKNWRGVPIPFLSGAVSFLVALVAFCIAIPSLGALEYEEYSYGTEARTLDYDRDPSGAHLVRQNDQNYTFRYSRENGDALGNRRCILSKKQVVFLDEDAANSSYVEGEVVATAKIDPISGRPLEIQGGKIFHPTKLYVLPSDVWSASAS